MESLARLFKLLGDANRLKILLALEEEPKSVSQLIEQTGLSQPLVSFHLKALREAGLVTTSRKATLVFNSLADSDLPRLIRQFEKYNGGSSETEVNFPFPCRPPWMKG
ncbi:ArsR/SmtB family transcription factor [Thermosinus carboxydivorans]|uniref:ArsR/SmtB family transcription factor n=1 Tax=Thermosinus carboxydivorans TaxID=261685 RepID=UPI0009FD62E8